ncbi:unnamed protein product [Fusarium equiseti]|uniref:Carboxylesterase type B domain-containing protein n=1 Tax=Fusarium equiseti TaxID=61235 RepID=A0A8J2IQE3_FUSEQ|nr:unnamed protein product [Fusarium equiseti]
MMSPSHILRSLTLFLGLTSAARVPAHLNEATEPTVSIQNGTLVGAVNPHYNVENFLGIPYAAPPVGQLRLQKPRPARGWTGARKATEYSPRCWGQSIHLIGFSQNTTDPMDEDCLSINVIRAVGTKADSKLPVVAWIHGGGYQEGSSRDGRNNGTFLVSKSKKLGTPILFVSFNYRVGSLGMLPGPELERAGLANLGLQDQRQALRWIQENVAAFGGDPSCVTIMGESVGALSVGFHLFAYGGKDDGLFSGAISQSGGPPLTVASSRTIVEREADFQRVVEKSGCGNSKAPLDCLRTVPAEVLSKAGADLPPRITVDGDMVRNLSTQLREGQFVRVPLIIGTTRNEGTTFLEQAVKEPIDTEKGFKELIGTSLDKAGVTNETIKRWAELYQDEIDNPTEGGLGAVLPNPGASYGSQFGKATLWLGDLTFVTNRRFTAQAWARYGVPSYSFVFNSVSGYLDSKVFGAAHFQEIPYVFADTEAKAWDENPFPSDPIERQKHYKLLDIMSRMWISFITTKSPNSHNVTVLNVNWPVYSNAKPQNIVFSSDGTHLQADSWRVEAIKQIFETYS